MIGENRHLADTATLNKHRKVTSEAPTRELPILANHMPVDHHPPLPLLTNEGWYGRPLSPFQLYCKPSNERQANTSTPHAHTRRSRRTMSAQYDLVYS